MSWSFLHLKHSCLYYEVFCHPHLLVLAAPFLSSERVATSLHAPSLPRSTSTYFTSLVTLQLTRLVCRNSEEQFLMSSRDARSAAGSAVDSAAQPAASLSPASVSPPTLS